MNNFFLSFHSYCSINNFYILIFFTLFLQRLESEKEKISAKAEDLHRLLSEARSSYELENNEVLELHAQLGKQLKESFELHELIVATMKRESQS